VEIVHQSTIDRWLCGYEQSGSMNFKPKSGRARTSHTKTLMNMVIKGLIPIFFEKICEQSPRTLKVVFEPSTDTHC
ncbi:unnamed protein product, partial [Rotaria sp. Silwood2]